MICSCVNLDRFIRPSPDDGHYFRTGAFERAGSARAPHQGRLATIKTLAGFDFSFQPSLDRNRIMTLASLDFIDKHEVVHLIGQSGIGKSHLAIGSRPLFGRPVRCKGNRRR